MLWFPTTDGSIKWSIDRPLSKIEFERSSHLPEAVRAEGMPARELDRVGPLAQADAALIHAYVNSDRKHQD